MTTFTAVPRAALAAVLALALAGCGKSADKLSGCTSRAECAPAQVCASGFCQADLAAPNVVDRSPARDAVNVWWNAPIVVTFDEPIDPATVTDASVQLTGPSGGALSRTWSLDGTRLTLSLPQPPGDLSTVRLSLALSAQLRDPAGNALAAPDTWGWEVPQWQEAAPGLTLAYDSTISFGHATDAAGNVTLVVQGAYSSIMHPEVRQAAGGAWTSLGTINRGATISPSGPALALDAQGHPVVAHRERPAGRTLVYVTRHDGTAWVPLGDAVNAATVGDAQPPELALDATGAPLVTWTELTAGVQRLFLARWTGTAWEALGSGLPSDPAVGVTAHAVGVSPTGVPTVAYGAGGALHLARYQSGLLRDAGPTLTADTSEVALTFDGNDAPVAAYALTGGGAAVAAWRDGFGAGWQPVGGALSATGSRVGIAWRPGGGPGQKLVAGFIESGPRVVGWDGTSWSSLADTIATPAKSLCCTAGPAIAGGAGGVISAVWGETFGPFTPTFRTMRFNR